jgi:SAM-dependent methyltransferase
MTHRPFDDLSDVYEALVDWPKRLVREAPFYRGLFADHDVHGIVDVACGTGHHAAMFHDWGYHVEGSDASPTMIDRARHQFGEPHGLRWIVRDFATSIDGESLADVVICVGNSLALASDHYGARQAVQTMMRAVRPGGIIILHVVNLWRLPDGPCIWQKCIQFEQPGRAAIVTKGIHRCGSQGYVDLVISSVDPPALLTTQSVPLLGLTDNQMGGWAREAGARSVRFYGDYLRTSYEQETSPDLIAVIERGAA